jgi:aminoglycoside phosphotransferase family enzyme/predicted kinase
MDYQRQLAALAQPSAYPYAVNRVEVRHTHISAVFLAGPFAYKIKKPVQLGFLDFSDLARRRYYCEEEVRLNRRLASTVYHGVVPVTQAGETVRFEGEGQPLDWAVKMERLPEENTLRAQLLRSQLSMQVLECLGQRLARFHADADRGTEIAAWGRFDVVAGNARENFEQARPLVGTTISPAVFERLRALTESSLERLQPLIEDRARHGVPRDTHGDLRLDHVYLFPDRPPPDDLVIIDCIEFNARFRYADPVADMAFLVMDLVFHGRRDLARCFAAAYSQASGDKEGMALLPFYTAYRAAVRAKVEGFELGEKEIPEEERSAALALARAHWLLALGELEEPTSRPCLLLIGGLPGSGKSTLARALSERAGFAVVRSDVVRKELAGSGEPRGGLNDGIYTLEWTERTYCECLRRAEQLLFEGKRVIVDATFQDDRRRQRFLATARRWAVPALFLVCSTKLDIARQRLQQRHGDVSDADWQVFEHARARWQTPSAAVRGQMYEIDTCGDRDNVMMQVLELLRNAISV